jgi:hypothetical protein
MLLRRLLALALVSGPLVLITPVFGPLALRAAPPAPPAPAVYQVEIRYRIDAIGNARIVQHAEMLQTLAKVGFKRTDIPTEDEPVNRAATRLSGTISSTALPKLMTQRHVRAVVARPDSKDLPAGDARVRVELFLADGFLPETQRLLSRQTVQALGGIGFIEAFGYDHENDSRLVGSLPAGKVGLLVNDLRTLPKADALPAPFRNLSSLRVALVRPDLPAPVGRPTAPTVPAESEKFSAELLSAIPNRLEVLLTETPSDDNSTWLDALRSTGAVVEGRVGPLVSLSGDGKTLAPALAKLPQVLGVRAARRAALAPPLAADTSADWSPLRRSGLVKLHALGRKGKGTRIALLADDFTGWESLPGVKEGRVRHLDLTAVRSSEILPAPAGDGRGKQYAQSLIAAAPEAQVYLVRLDPYAPYMMLNVARAINRETPQSVLLEQRFRELQDDEARRDRQKVELDRLREEYFNDPRENEEGKKRRAAYEKADADFKKLDESIRARSRRWVALSLGFRELREVQLVASTLVWNDGYPVEGSSALSRYFDDRPFKAALWFQAAGDTRGQTWSSLFQDTDGNGQMEFVARGKRLPEGAWTPEIAWIDWQGTDGKSAAMPANTPLRVVLQWKEAHDPLPLKVGEDPYRRPLANFRVLVVRQVDPTGKTRPADDLEVVGQSIAVPQRLDQSTNAGIYEILLPVQVGGPGRYGILIEGTVPASTSPPGENTIPASRRRLEIRPRLYLDSPATGGRPVFRDYATDTAAFGMPADARRVYSVGAVDGVDQPRPDGAQGSVWGAELRTRPDLRAHGLSSADAVSFAVGLTASAVSVKGSFASILETIRERPGQLLRAPESISP